MSWGGELKGRRFSEPGWTGGILSTAWPNSAGEAISPSNRGHPIIDLSREKSNFKKDNDLGEIKIAT